MNPRKLLSCCFSVADAGVPADVVIPAVANVLVAIGFLMFLVSILIVVGVCCCW